MRRASLSMLLLVVACGGDPGFTEGTGGVVTGGGGVVAATGGELSGGAPSAGGAHSGGGISTGGSFATGGVSSGSAGSTGGAVSTGGALSSGGSGSSASGGASAIGPCINLPKLTNFVGVGMDQNNLCGWWLDGSSGAPEGYASVGLPIDCTDSQSLERIDIPLTDSNGVRYSPVVEIIDPAERCSTGTMDGVDRRFTFAAGYCIKVTSPFKGFTWNGFARESGCGVTTTSATPSSINLGEQGWVKVETAELVGGACPLSC